jgi:proteasome lid subunit RPN8/RPN11
VRDISPSLLELYGDGTGAERCGLILTRGTIIEAPNIAADPEHSYEISPEIVLKYLPRLKGTWHTHPGQDANLSEEDDTGFKNWPKLTHYIIGSDGVRAYTVNEAGLVVNA